MAEKLASKTTRNRTARVGKARGGRPTRAEALRRQIAAAGIDPSLVDPRWILAGIAADPDAPASARVSACKLLLATSSPLLPDLPAEIEEETREDASVRRALQILAHGRPN